jgi:tRNA-dihydrouridine synthase B
MKLDWKNQERPILALSPMADMTDSAFCQVVRDVVSTRVENSRLIVFREMVSSEAVVRENDKTMGMTEIHPAERPLVQQIFGADPNVMADAARIVNEGFHPEGIDINMGCPVYKITSNFNGSALMKDVDLATSIVKQMKAAITVPLSVKMRAGWSNHNECIEFAKHIENAGADLITVHGRTKEQGYAGLSHRDVVAKVKKAVSIPVLYNGDVFTWEDYFVALEETKCDGVLIARGGLGNPWIFSQIEQKLAGNNPHEVDLEERVTTAKNHLEHHIAQYGDQAVTTFRKHMSWYFKGIPHFKEFKTGLMTAKDKETVFKILDSIPEQIPEALTLKA